MEHSWSKPTVSGCFTDKEIHQHYQLFNHWLGMLTVILVWWCNKKSNNGSELCQACSTLFWPSERHAFPTWHLYSSLVATCDLILLPQRTECACCVHLISCWRRAQQGDETSPANQENEERSVFLPEKEKRSRWKRHALRVKKKAQLCSPACLVYPATVSLFQHSLSAVYSPVWFLGHQRSRMEMRQVSSPSGILGSFPPVFIADKVW